MSIAERYEEIAHCNRCGFCQAACPIFRSTGHEAGVARGRLALLRALIEGRIEWSPELEAPLYTCLLCGACTSNCFPAIATGELVVQARAEYLQKVGRTSIHRLLFDRLLPHPRRLHLAARAAALGKNSGASRLARALGLLRVFGPDFAHAEEIVDSLPTQPLRVRYPEGIYPGQGAGPAVAYFVGCGVDVVQTAAGAATLKLLRRHCSSVQVLGTNCCGLPAFSYGDREAARRLAAKNLEILAATGAAAVVTDCSSCAGFIKSYPRLFSGGHPLSAAARAAAARTQDASEWLQSAPPAESGRLRGRRVTFHDPCHAVRGQGILSEPRRLLQRQPGATFVELAEADWCCGGAGSYALSHYELAMRVLDRKMENLKKSEADLVVTTCPACILQLAHGVRRHGLAVEVRHLTEVL
ncbi:MAG: (Fe-S)-binding protein [Desulfobacterales bacterium]|jgi:glycolate oxidase iron-sulfur subunit|nr:(Fe-S)-binding protein [Desulfobacterales bacterium]